MDLLSGNWVLDGFTLFFGLFTIFSMVGLIAYAALLIFAMMLGKKRFIELMQHGVESLGNATLFLGVILVLLLCFQVAHCWANP